MEVRPEIGMPEPEPPVSGEADSTKTITLTEKDVRDAARLFRLISDRTSWASLLLSNEEEPSHSSAEPSPRDELISRAKTVLLVRRFRAQHFNRVMFGEPA